MDTISPLRFMVPPQAVQPSNDALQTLTSAKFIPPGELAGITQTPALDPAASSDAAATLAALPTGQATSFQNLLGGFVNEVSQKQAAAGDAVNGLLSGKNVSLHQAVISMEEASVSFQMMVEVRNKLLDSYQEIMRMQV